MTGVRMCEKCNNMPQIDNPPTRLCAECDKVWSAFEFQAIGPSIKFAQDIVDRANKHEPGEQRAPFATLVAELTLQTVLTHLFVQKYAPGSAEGAEAIALFYDDFKKAALARWQKDDLKMLYGKDGKR